MKLTFAGSGETAVLELDRKNKKLIVTSTKTNNIPTETEWNKLFDTGKEEIQEKITDTLSDSLFIKQIAKDMGKVGYILINSKC